MLCATCKPLHTQIEEIIKDKDDKEAEDGKVFYSAKKINVSSQQFTDAGLETRVEVKNSEIDSFTNAILTIDTPAKVLTATPTNIIKLIF